MKRKSVLTLLVPSIDISWKNTRSYIISAISRDTGKTSLQRRFSIGHKKDLICIKENDTSFIARWLLYDNLVYPNGTSISIGGKLIPEYRLNMPFWYKYADTSSKILLTSLVQSFCNTYMSNINCKENEECSRSGWCTLAQDFLENGLK